MPRPCSWAPRWRQAEQGGCAVHLAPQRGTSAPSDFQRHRRLWRYHPCHATQGAPHPGVPGPAHGEAQGMGGMEGTGGCSRLLLCSMTFQCSVRAEHLQGETASAPAGFAPCLRSRPAAGRAARSCLDTCPGARWAAAESGGGGAGPSQLCMRSRASPLLRLWHPQLGRSRERLSGVSWVRAAVWGGRRLAAWALLARLPCHQGFGHKREHWVPKPDTGGPQRRSAQGACHLCAFSAPLPQWLGEQGGSTHASPTTSPPPRLGSPAAPAAGFSAWEHP